jgi:Fe2+ or Zn2+ uptake regulation protein
MIRTVYDSEGNIKYELNFYSHINLVCNKCGRIIDYRGEIIDEIITVLEKKLGAKILSYSFDVKIDCQNCRELEKISMIR